MVRDKYDKWLELFMRYWKDLDWKNVIKILSNDVEYYENPIDKPCESFDDVIDLWKVVGDNQKVIDYKYDIVLCDDKYAIVNWKMKRIINNSLQDIDGIFQISIDKDGKCCYFKQWRYTKVGE